MESSRFDAFVRVLDRTLSRRRTLAALFGALPAAQLVPRETAGKGKRRRDKGKDKGKKRRGGHVVVCHSSETLRVPRYAVRAIELDGGSVGACPPGGPPPGGPPPTSCPPDTRQWKAQMIFGGGERPLGVAVSADGQTLWVADTLNHRITVWARSGGVFVQQTAFGSLGSRPHQFNAPNDVAVAADGRTAWVADRGNHRVSVWVRSGNAWVNLTTFGSRGSGSGALNNPNGIAVSPDGQTVWVVDFGNHRISVWAKSGDTWVNTATFGSRGDAPDQLWLPGGVAVSDDGQTVWVADTNNHRIAVWTKSGGAWVALTTFGSRGRAPDQFNAPEAVAVSADGQTAWVVDTSNARIAVWMRSGDSWTNQTTFGSRGSAPNQFDGPLGVAVAADEQTVWVADTLNNRISVWALTCPPAKP